MENNVCLDISHFCEPSVIPFDLHAVDDHQGKSLVTALELEHSYISLCCKELF